MERGSYFRKSMFYIISKIYTLSFIYKLLIINKLLSLSLSLWSLIVISKQLEIILSNFISFIKKTLQSINITLLRPLLTCHGQCDKKKSKKFTRMPKQQYYAHSFKTSFNNIFVQLLEGQLLNAPSSSSNIMA